MLFAKTRFRLTKALLGLAFLFINTAFINPGSVMAANVVDPDSIGANDVYAGGIPLYLFTPLPEHLDLLDFDLVVGDTTLGDFIIDGGSSVSNGNSIISKGPDSAGVVTVFGNDSLWQTLGDLTVGDQGLGFMFANEGGNITSRNAYLAREGGKAGAVTITGEGSTWVNEQEITILSGSINLLNQGKLYTEKLTTQKLLSNTNADTQIAIRNGALLTGHMPRRNFISLQPDDSPIAVMNSVDLRAQIPESNLEIELGGYSRLDLSGGGKIYSQSASLLGDSITPRRRGSIRVGLAGEDTVWHNTGDLTLQETQLNISNSARLTNRGKTTIGEESRVLVSVGEFDFGTTDLESFNRIFASGGKLSGKIPLTGITNMEQLSGNSFNTSADIKMVELQNLGILFGNGSVQLGLHNTREGKVFVNQSMEFGGLSENDGEINVIQSVLRIRNRLINRGEILNVNGQLMVEGDLINYGTIAGRQSLHTSGTLYNSGRLDFDGGVSQVEGEVVNQGSYFTALNTLPTNLVVDFLPYNAQINVSNQGLVEFNNRVLGAGAINVEAGSTARFNGGFEGRGTTGEGLVFLAGKIATSDFFLSPTIELYPRVFRTVDAELDGVTHPLPDLYPFEYFQRGEMNFGGDVTISAGAVVELDISGLGLNDHINVAGTLTLNSNLALNLVAGESLKPQDTFTLITASEIVGSFRNLNQIELDGPLEWEFLQTETEISVTAILPGDFNNDWSVDAADYSVWRDHYASQDGRVSQQLLRKWLNNYGTTYVPSLSPISYFSQAIPEPNSAILLLSFSLTFVNRRSLLLLSFASRSAAYSWAISDSTCRARIS